MPADVAVYLLRGNRRSQLIGHALADGAKRSGYTVRVRFDDAFTGARERIAAFYGYQKTHPEIMRAFLRNRRRVVFVDLGYWRRHEGGRFNGYHKVAVDDRHPTAHFQNVAHDTRRLEKIGIEPRPWRKSGECILLAGMSGKSAASYGYAPEEWERWAIEKLREHTDRPILYRPKPSWTEARPIPGTKYNDPRSPLHTVLRDCHAVVTHHSNVAVDALVAGVPVFCCDGVAVPMARQDLGLIERPRYPDGRKQWMADVAYAQWSVPEMRSGAMWRFLKDEGLIP